MRKEGLTEVRDRESEIGNQIKGGIPALNVHDFLPAAQTKAALRETLISIAPRAQRRLSHRALLLRANPQSS